MERFQNLLGSTNWTDVYSTNDAEIGFDSFIFEFTGLFNICFPVTKRKFNKNLDAIEPFMSSDLLKSRNNKLSLHSKKVKHPSPENIENYHKYRNIYNKLIRAAKKLYYKRALLQNKSDLRKTWSILKEAMNKGNKKSISIEKLIFDGKICEKTNDISENFNQYFTSIPHKVASEINTIFSNPIDNVPHLNTNFNLDNVTSSQITDIVKGMVTKKSCDMFEVSNFLLKKIIHVISMPLCHIFNLSINHGKVPTKLKNAKVVPIFKLKNSSSSDRCVPKNYRPVSLLPIFSKILEKVVAKQLISYIEENDILYKHQYGFQSKKSTMHPLVHFLNELGKAKNDNMISIGVFCDISRGFDTLCPSIMAKKLEKMGIRHKELEWFKSYLCLYRWSKIKTYANNNGCTTRINTRAYIVSFIHK